MYSSFCKNILEYVLSLFVDEIQKRKMLVVEKKCWTHRVGKFL